MIVSPGRWSALPPVPCHHAERRDDQGRDDHKSQKDRHISQMGVGGTEANVEERQRHYGILSSTYTGILSIPRTIIRNFGRLAPLFGRDSAVEILSLEFSSAERLGKGRKSHVNQMA